MIKFFAILLLSYYVESQTTTIIPTTTTTTTTTSTTSTTSTLTTITFPIVTTPHSETRNPNQNFGTCNCDLTLNVCDVGCCCDASCLAADLKAFNCPTTTLKTNYQQWCVPNSALFLQNTPYIINSLGDLVCVDLNNSLSMNYYKAPLLDGTNLKEEYVTQLVNSAFPQTTQPLAQYSLQMPQNAEYFKTSDYVWQIYTTNTLDYLTLPIQVGSKCRQGPPVYYLKDKESNCFINSNVIRSECSAGVTSSLSLGYFLNEFKIIQKPNSLKTCLSTQTSPIQPFGYYLLCDNKYLTNINIRSCSFEDGSQIPAQDCKTSYLQPTLLNNVCNNLVKSITFIFRFKNPSGIIEAGVDVVFFNYANLQTSSVSVEQKFKVLFIPDTVTLANFDSVYGQKLSGNPGYQKGQPLLAGSTAIVQDRNKKFTHLQPNSEGNCPRDDSIRGPIKFGANLVTECIYKPNLDPNLDSYCTLLQSEIDNILLGYTIDRRANRFAPFANSDPNTWNLIRNSDPASQPTVTNLNGVCKSIRIATTIQIAYALVGNVDNPQAEIQFISYNWNEVIDVNLRCSGQFCINANNLRFRLSTRVTFVDVSQPPLYPESIIAKPQTNLPGDFFYPLTSSAFNQITVLTKNNFFYLFLLNIYFFLI